MTTYICKCGRRVKKSTDTSTTGNRLSGYAPGHECWDAPTPCHTETINGMKVLELSAGRLRATNAG